jgi:hypothetical protein
LSQLFFERDQAQKIIPVSHPPSQEKTWQQRNIVNVETMSFTNTQLESESSSFPWLKSKIFSLQFALASIAEQSFGY